MKKLVLVGVVLGILFLGLGTARGRVTAAGLPLPEAPAEPAVCSALASGGGTAFRSTLIATKDSYVNDAAPDTNYGTADSLRVGRFLAIPSGGYYRSFVAFDLSSLPADAIILTATLELYQTSAGNVSLAVQRLTADWAESGVTWNTMPAATTTGEAVGGLSGGWYRWDITAMAQQWRTMPATNYGVQLLATGLIPTPYYAHYFGSRESANAPRLVVEYVRQTMVYPQADVYVSQANPTTNYSVYDTLSVRDGSGGNASHTLIRFDLSGIPEGSTVVSASLGLNTYFARLQSPTAPQAIDVAPEAALATWNETTVTWNSAPASESQGDPVYAWVTTLWNWLDVANVTRAWVSGETDNHGFKLTAASGVGSAIFYSRERGGGEPRLIITYGPPPCYPATSVTIGGATQGITDTQYTFNANILPVTATLPITYTWEADEQIVVSGQQSAVTYTWATTGTKTITVTVENCESSIVDTHQVVINAPTPACEFPLTDVTLGGPATGFIETEYMYTATSVPPNATEPITYTWQATGQSDYTGESATYTWATPGMKQITVTAQNCGGTVVQHYSVNVQPRPDLTISGAWYNVTESRVYYILKNVGGGTAPAGFTVQLSNDGSPAASDVFDAPVPPGATRSGSFPYAWTCAGTTAEMQVCADATGVIPEDDEANNCFQQTWSCDLTPPQITSGPAVATVGENYATISWTTDEPCISRLEYGRNGPFNIQVQTNDTLKTSHTVALTGLNSGSLYWYKVVVTDTAGNFNTSVGQFFETLLVGSGPVYLGNIGMANYQPPTTEAFEFFTLYAHVDSNVAGVDHVSFFLNGQHVGRDHSPDGNRYEVYFSPAAWGMTRQEWYGQNHTLQVQGYNLLGDPVAKVATVRPMPARQVTGRALITSPGSGYEMLIDGATAPAGTTLKVWGYGVEYLWKCESEIPNPDDVPPGLEYVDCGDVRQKVQRMRLFLGTTEVGDHTPADGEFSHQFTVDLAGKSAGTHNLMFVITLSDGRTLTAERQIVLKQGVGELALERTVTRNGNVFKVDLTLRNAGSGTVYVDYMDDYAFSFRVVEKETTNYVITAMGSAGTPHHMFRIDFRNGGSSEITLAPEATFHISYQLVPVFFEQIEYLVTERYFIGVGASPIDTAFITYRLQTGGALTRPFYVDGNVIDGVYVGDAVRQAYASADYVLVTAPGRLLSFVTLPTWRAHAGKEREFNLVLSGMAELASLRNGVLGFLPSDFTAAELDRLLEPGGRWANALHPNFRGYEGTGYVLFVGEHEVIPSQGAGYDVGYSDLRYASTSGQAKPELVLGRIVGNDLGTLARGLNAAIRFHREDVGFDRSHALGLSGTDDNSTRERKVFWGDIQAAGTTFSNRGNFVVTRLRGKDTNWETFKNAVATAHPDVFFYSGHGSPGGWHLLNSGNLWELDFGATSPIALAFACSTGDYKAGNNTMPEAWLRHGGAVYVGATSKSYDYPDSDAVRAFANYWPLSTQERNIGQVFTYIKRHKWAHDYEWKMFAYQYHLYGDPTYGSIVPTGVQQNLTLTALQAATTLDVTVPDFEITPTEDGLDAVEIPGGGIWFRQEGDYRLPYWTVSQDYPQGQRVQAVTLTLQAGLEITTGLHIPTMTLDIRCPGCAPALAPQSEAEWVPDVAQPYAWQVVDNSDGTSTLELRIYPFFYNPGTTDVRFYKEWSFDIDVFSSTVDIVSLRPTQLAYGLAENVTATLLVHNSGAEQMFVAQTVVKSLSEEVESALPLRALRAITGTSLIDLVITETLAAGDYYLEVTLLDMEGRVLDTEMTEFTVGIVAGEVTGLTATPSLFKPGDNIALALTFQNTGDVPLNGVAVIRVEGEIVAGTVEFTHTLSALAPGAITTFNNVWDSTGATDETYRVVGYVTHDFGAFAPREVIFSTRAYIYLPLVLKSGN